MDIQNKRISDGEFERLRQEVLAQWPTGKDVNLEEAIAYHKAMPECRNFGKKLLDAKRDGRTLVQPRAGVPVIEEHIKLMQYLEKEGEAERKHRTIVNNLRLFIKTVEEDKRVTSELLKTEDGIMIIRKK